jgi:hypothetical protein
MHPRVAAQMMQALRRGAEKAPIVGAEFSKWEQEVLKTLSVC